MSQRGNVGVIAGERGRLRLGGGGGHGLTAAGGV
jgi:hypothetical protein